MKMDLTPARGTRDLLPSTVAVRDHVLARITEVYRRYGYQRIETPALENIERLQGGQGGENQKLIYQVLRRGLEPTVADGTPLSDLVDLGLRFDLTVPLSRFYGANRATLPQPFRSFQFGPVWRAERPAKGRYRQFYQCDIDVLGEPSVLAEVELIEATSAALTAAGLSGTTVRVSDRRFLSALAEQCGVPADGWDRLFITLDKLDKIGWDKVRAELTDRVGIDEATAGRLQATITGLQGLDAAKLTDQLSTTLPGLGDDVLTDLTTTVDGLAALPGLTWEFDPTLVRGMGYYTGQIFEVTHPASGGSVAGGGRYDRLVGRFLGTDVPACGFSIGFERIVDLLASAPRREAVAVLYETDTPVPEVLTIARELRQGDRAVSPVRRSGKFGAQLTRLEEWGFTSFVHVKPGETGLERVLGDKES
ncbi:histidyl-tRNA synthetase [Actinophytocola algeriensis]|uniref:Histidine--tRNA ligase n=2 Tax=Actinophytocola algeriensis TaxID=1768010 RepID=A0A7W7QAW7_9PSEU|nr:histidyl-tRNA synthetase [Actinophytocola algeriensis]MBE1476063.1 histidyl-tRNA synthetase [Actinophytocola algeriensis]